MRPSTAVKLLVAPCQPSLSFVALSDGVDQIDVLLAVAVIAAANGVALRPLAKTSSLTPLTPWTNCVTQFHVSGCWRHWL